MRLGGDALPSSRLNWRGADDEKNEEGGQVN
jgi:hypothetical protein